MTYGFFLLNLFFSCAIVGQLRKRSAGVWIHFPFPWRLAKKHPEFLVLALVFLWWQIFTIEKCKNCLGIQKMFFTEVWVYLGFGKETPFRKEKTPNHCPSKWKRTEVTKTQTESQRSFYPRGETQKKIHVTRGWGYFCTLSPGHGINKKSIYNGILLILIKPAKIRCHIELPITSHKGCRIRYHEIRV